MQNNPSSSTPEPPQGLSIFILAGQSNMSGRGDIEDLDDNAPQSEIWALNADLGWQPAQHPLHWDKPKARVGPGLPFAQTLLKQGFKGPIGLIPCAVGGTPLSRWEHGADLYERMVRWTTIAMTCGELKGVIWHQGEADSHHLELANSYFGRLLQMINALRKDLGNTKLPFITGDIGSFIKDRDSHSHFEIVNQALGQIAEHVPNCAGIATADLGHIGDQLHFDTAAAEEMGKRYAMAYLSMTGQIQSDDDSLRNGSRDI